MRSYAGIVFRQNKSRAHARPSPSTNAGLLQLDLGDSDVVAVHVSGHTDFDVFGLFQIGDEFLGLLVAGGIELDDLLVFSKHAITASHALRHLQAILGMLGAESGL